MCTWNNTGKRRTQGTRPRDPPGNPVGPARRMLLPPNCCSECCRWVGCCCTCTVAAAVAAARGLHSSGADPGRWIAPSGLLPWRCSAANRGPPPPEDEYLGVRGERRRVGDEKGGGTIGQVHPPSHRQRYVQNKGDKRWRSLSRLGQTAVAIIASISPRSLPKPPMDWLQGYTTPKWRE